MKGGEKMTNKIKPGTATPKSGQYVQVGPRGGNRGKNEITSIKGKPLPPTDVKGNKWVLVDPTKHKQ